MNTPRRASRPEQSVLAAVAEGLGSRPRTLPPWLFYDQRGSELFERITELPEYYPYRAERGILEAHGDEIVTLAAAAGPEPLKIVELGAGSGKKTLLLLRALVRRQGRCQFVPVDVSASAMQGLVDRLGREEPSVLVRPVVGTHTDALDTIERIGPRRLVLFLGSSIGNLSDSEGVGLLSAVARRLSPGDSLLLGADRRKDPAVLIPAYDDSAGITAAFDLHLLERLNTELGADFDLSRWKHTARWNDAESRIEMHLVSRVDQTVHVPGIGVLAFEAGESIHTESSAKYTRPRIEALLRASGYEIVRVFTDAEDRFDLYLGRRTDRPLQG